MNPKLLIIAVTTLIAVIIASQLIKPKPAPPASLDPQTNSQGSVTVTVTPQLNSDSFQFEIVLDTHSTDLNFDLTQISVLKDNKGREYQPVSWQGDPPGGHHRQGILEFSPISPRPSSIQLIIQDIDEINQRKFTWNL